MRKAEIKRKTNETDIVLSLNLDGQGKCNIKTGCGFLDHMLTLFSHHSLFDLDVLCKGDVNVDYHHTTEDIAIVLGQAFSTSLSDKCGITRFASALIPMDESLIEVAVDISSRSHLSYNCDINKDKVGDFDTELAKEFWEGFVRSAGLTMHITKKSGENAHHIIEAMFKACAVALKNAVSIDEKQKKRIPSTKGIL